MSNIRVALVRPMYKHKGDLAIVKGTLEVFRKLGMSDSINYLIDPELGFPQDFSIDNSISAEIIYTWIKEVEQSTIEKQQGLNLYIMALKHFIKSTRNLKNICHTDCMWYVGGIRFSENSKYPFGELVNALSKKKILSSKLIFGGISMSRGDNSLIYRAYRPIYKKLLLYADHIYARDHLTYSFLVKTLDYPTEKTSLVCDMAFHLTPLESGNSTEIKKSVENYTNTNGKPALGVVVDVSELKSAAKGFDNEYFKGTLSIIKEFTKKYTVFLVPMSHNPSAIPPPFTQDDKEVCKEMNHNLKFKLPILQTENMQPEEIIDVMTGFDGLISIGRLHGAVFGVLADIPTVHVYKVDKAFMFKTLFGDFPLIHANSLITIAGRNDIVRAVDNSIEDYNSYMPKVKKWRIRSIRIIRTDFKDMGLL